MGGTSVQVPFFQCNVGCPGGPCAEHTSAPVVLVTGPPGDQIGAIAVGADALYYGTIARDIFTRGVLRKVPLAGGAPSVLASHVQVSKIQLETDGSISFLSDEVQAEGMRLWSIVDGMPPQELWVNDYAIPGFFVGQDVIVELAQGSRGYIEYRSGASGGALAILTGAPHGFAIDDANVYWTSGDGPSQLASWPRDNHSGAGPPGRNALASADDELAGPIIEGADLFFNHAYGPMACLGSVITIPKAGGAPKLVSLGQSGVGASSFAADAAFVYWTTPVNGGLVFRAARGGGMPEVIAKDQAGVRAVALDASRVYWIAVGPTGDEVRAIQK
jgi:hypothetical protein